MTRLATSLMAEVTGIAGGCKECYLGFQAQRLAGIRS
jgi:hypothetical protein